MYLEGIFIGSDDIKAQLPEAAKAFDRVDQLFKKIMTMTAKNSNVVGACLVENRLEDLRQLSSSLDKCQKSLSDYLESKRNAFARFFFMSGTSLFWGVSEKCARAEITSRENSISNHRACFYLTYCEIMMTAL